MHITKPSFPEIVLQRSPGQNLWETLSILFSFPSRFTTFEPYLIVTMLVCFRCLLPIRAVKPTAKEQGKLETRSSNELFQNFLFGVVLPL